MDVLAIYEHWPDPITAALVGTAAVGSTGLGIGGAAAVAATSGLIGTAGAVTAGGVLAATGIGVGIAGGLGAAGAAAAQAKGQQAVADFNARVQKREAEAIEQQTAFRQRRAAQEGARQASRLRAAIGASGAVVGAGTPLLVQATQLAESELNVLLIGQQGRVAAGRARSQGRLDQLQAGLFGQRIGAARTAGALGAGTTLLKGFQRLRR